MGNASFFLRLPKACKARIMWDNVFNIFPYSLQFIGEYANFVYLCSFIFEAVCTATTFLSFL